MTATTGKNHKFCVDCAHYKETYMYDYIDTDCVVYSIRRPPNKITGYSSIKGIRPCWWMRSWFGKCGPDGKLWKKKDDNEGIL